MNKNLILILLSLLPFTVFGQLTDSYLEMKNDKTPEFEKYEPLLFEATEYIFDHPINIKSKEFISATKIIGFWMNKDIGFGIPTFGNFFTILNKKDKQQTLYTVAMMNYGLDQKINHNRILKTNPIKGQKYSEQKDVKEIQLEGAKILLDYLGNKKNNVTISSKIKQYLKAHKKNKLEVKFFL